MKSSTAFDLPSEVINTHVGVTLASCEPLIYLSATFLFLADTLAYDLSVPRRGMQPQIEPVNLLLAELTASAHDGTLLWSRLSGRVPGSGELDLQVVYHHLPCLGAH